MTSRNSVKMSFHNVFDALKSHLISKFMQLSGNLGSHQLTEKLFPLTRKISLDSMPLPVYADGKNIHHWLHAEDRCRMIDLDLQNGRVGEK